MCALRGLNVYPQLNFCICVVKTTFICFLCVPIIHFKRWKVHTSICMLVFAFVYQYVCVCMSRDSLAFPYFKTAWATQRTRPSPTWLPLMFHINHRFVCVSVCMLVCVRRGGVFFAHTQRNVSDPWHPWLKPLITTQINSPNIFIHPFVRMYESSEEEVSEGQFT